MPIMRFNTKVKYGTERYAANTDIKVKEADVAALKARGGFTVQPVVKTVKTVEEVAPPVAKPVIAAEEAVVVVSTPEDVISEEADLVEAEGSFPEAMLPTEEVAGTVVTPMVYDPKGKKADLVAYAEGIGISISDKWDKARIIEEIEKVV